MNYRKTWLIALTIVTCLGTTATLADPPNTARRPNLLIFGLGATYWPGAHDLDPAGSPFASELGRFHTWGFNFEFGYQRRVAQWGGTTVLVGGDFGVFGNENSRDLDVVLLPFGNTVDGSLLARGLYLTPSVRFVFSGSARWRFFAGAGLGYYEADIAQVLDDGFEADELTSESDLGGYLSLGFDRRLWSKRPNWRLRVETKTHFADFGATDRYAPGAGDLDGPIQTVTFGIVWDL